jgi:ATP-dependent DNA helicase DinG
LTELAALRAEVAAAFAPGGELSQVDAGFRPRPGQTQMADAVATTLAHRDVLVVEAGTGVGKTYAYLVPVLLSGLRTLVSTATKSLQDQLFGRDLPRLTAALGLPVRLALLKGRGAYLCLQRLDIARQQAQLPDRASVRLLARIETWAQSTGSGDLSEIDQLDERSPVIPLVTSSRENCLGSDCPRYRECHVMAARREAMTADIVVVNHHLYFADLALRDSGVAELLPSVEAVVFDEAHQLSEAGVNFLGSQLSTAQLIDFTRDLQAIGLTQARGQKAWALLAAAIEQAARELRLAAAGSLRAQARLRWEERAAQPEFIQALAQAAAACEAAVNDLADVAGASPDLAKLHERAAELAARLCRFGVPEAAERVRWIELTHHHARLAEAPLDIRETLREQVESQARAWVFTSATLGAEATLRWFTESAGLEEAHTLQVQSPFDYGAHARLYVPLPFPRPGDPGHLPAVAALAARCALALGGRTFVLTTTLKAMQLLAEWMEEQFKADLDAAPIQLLVQGSAPKRALLQRFVAGPRCVLIGSQSFWEGIDVPGEALQCVLIDKLPFPPPGDPLVQARSRRIEAQGGDAFADHFVAEAAISLKQGAGRLIRSEADRGLLVVCDPRLQQMGYGRRLREALPPMQPVSSEADALAWLHALAGANREDGRIGPGDGVSPPVSPTAADDW